MNEHEHRYKVWIDNMVFNCDVCPGTKLLFNYFKICKHFLSAIPWPILNNLISNYSLLSSKSFGGEYNIWCALICADAIIYMWHYIFYW